MGLFRIEKTKRQNNYEKFDNNNIDNICNRL